VGKIKTGGLKMSRAEVGMFVPASLKLKPVAIWLGELSVGQAVPDRIMFTIEVENGPRVSATVEFVRRSLTCIESFRTVDFVGLVDTLVVLVCAVSLTVRIGIFRSHASPLTGGGSASLDPRNALFALRVAAKHFVTATPFVRIRWL
jgi:hypothetical protein